MKLKQNKVKLCGVYDLDLFRYLKKMGVKHFGFDLRPTSFNFIPLAQIAKMLETAGEADDRYYFMFGNEKDFVIERLLDFVRKKNGGDTRNFRLEFTESLDFASCSRFGLPVTWRFHESMDFRKIMSSDLLSELSIGQDFLERLRESNQLYPFILELLALKKERQTLELRLDWSDQPLESVLDFLPVDTFSFEINSKVEDGYRHINMGLVGSHLEHTRRVLNI